MDPYYQREEGWNNPCYSNSYPPPHKHHHRHTTPTYPHEPKVDILPFYEIDNFKIYLDWEMKVD